MGAMISGEDRWSIFTQSVDLASVAANTAADQDITVAGVKTGDLILNHSGLAQTAGLACVGARVSAADTITLRMANLTGSPIDQGAVTMTFMVWRPERPAGTMLIIR